MIAPESGAEIYEAVTSQHGVEPSSDLESTDDGLQKWKDLGSQDTDPYYLRIQVFNTGIGYLNM